MARVTLLAGGNVGNVKQTLQAAQQLINRNIGAVMRCSHRYESPAWGFESQQNFSNQALEVDTDLTPDEVLERIHLIEAELGRDREAERLEKEQSGQRYASRIIDIDIIFYDELVRSDERLTLPHPLMVERGFVLQPLAEIMRSKRHPVSGKTVGEMLDEWKAKENQM